MQVDQPKQPEQAADGSLDWKFTPLNHRRGGHAEIYGVLEFDVHVYSPHSNVSEDVHLSLAAGAASVRSTLTPDDADALAAALRAGAAAARDNADSRRFLEDVHERMTDPDYDPELETFVHPLVHYCHPDDFIETCKRYSTGHIVIARKTEDRTPVAEAQP